MCAEGEEEEEECVNASNNVRRNLIGVKLLVHTTETVRMAKYHEYEKKI